MVPPERQIDRILALDITEESHGNANGIGMADIITRRLRDKIDLEATYVNGLTAGFLWGIKMPIAMSTDREAIELLARPYPSGTARGVLVGDTAHLDEMLVSEGLLEEVQGNNRLEVASPLQELEFDHQGTLLTTV